MLLCLTPAGLLHILYADIKIERRVNDYILRYSLYFWRFNSWQLKNERLHACFSIYEVMNTPFSVFLFFMLITYLHNLWMFCTANYFDTIIIIIIRHNCSSVKTIMSRHKPIVMNHYYSGLNFVGFSKKRMKFQGKNNMPGCLLRKPSGEIMGHCIVPSFWGACGRSLGRWF